MSILPTLLGSGVASGLVSTLCSNEIKSKWPVNQLMDFLPQWHMHIPGCQCQISSGSKCDFGSLIKLIFTQDLATIDFWP